MTRHWGLGPVFAYEWLIASRRWQLYAVRSLFVAVLLLALAFAYLGEVGRQPVTANRLAEVGEAFFHALVSTQLTLILFLAPGSSAGAVCLDKARGALAHLLVTHLSDAEIVLGKLAARLFPVFGLVACSLPVLFLATLLGGIAPESLLGAYLVIVGVAALGCTLGLALSVWGSRMHEVLLVTYAIEAAWVLAYPLWIVFEDFLGLGTVPDWLYWSNPYWLAFSPYSTTVTTGPADYLEFFGLALGLSLVLVLVMVARLRAVAVRQLGRAARDPKAKALRRRFWRPGPALDGNPVLWFEWHRRRPAHLLCRVVWRLYAVAAVGLTALALTALWQDARNQELAALVAALVVGFGLVLVSVRSVTALAEERARGSLDVLLSTPLTTFAIVWGKWWGAYRVMFRLALLPALLAATSAWTHDGRWLQVALLLGQVLAFGAGLTSLGLALASWVPRLGRAVGFSVTAYVLVSLGWVFLGQSVLDAAGPVDRHWTIGLLSASPWVGVLISLFVIQGNERGLEDWWAVWCLFWIGAYALTAGLLFLATLATFNRCLGRVATAGMTPSRGPAPASEGQPERRGIFLGQP